MKNMTISHIRNTRKNFTLKYFSKIFHDIEGAKGTILEGDPKLERYMAIRQGIEKTFTSYLKLYDKKESNVQAILKAKK